MQLPPAEGTGRGSCAEWSQRTPRTLLSELAQARRCQDGLRAEAAWKPTLDPLCWAWPASGSGCMFSACKMGVRLCLTVHAWVVICACSLGKG